MPFSFRLLVIERRRTPLSHAESSLRLPPMAQRFVLRRCRPWQLVTETLLLLGLLFWSLGGWVAPRTETNPWEAAIDHFLQALQALDEAVR